MKRQEPATSRLSGMTRRQATAALLGAASACIGAAPAFAQRPIELGILGHPNFAPNSSLKDVADTYKDVWSRFEAENPGVRLRLEPHAGNTEALQEILTKASANRLPDVGVMDTFWIPRLHAGNYLQPMDDILSAADRQDYLPGVLEATTHGGSLRSIYIYNSWRGLFYRPSAVAKFGYKSPPVDWQDFLKFGAAAKKAGFPSAIMLPANKSELTMLYLFPQFLGLGGQIHDDNGRPNFFEAPNRAKLEQVLQMWRDLVAQGLMPAQVGSMDELKTRPFFYSGETATLGSSTSFIKQHYLDQPQLVGDLNVVPLPMPGGATPVPLLAAWGYVIFTKDPERQAVAKKFVRHMLAPATLGRLNAVQGHLPVRKSIWRDVPAFSQDPIMQSMFKIQSDSRLRERSIFPIYPAIKDAISEQVAEVIAGQITPARAIDRARDFVMAAYARMR